MTSGARACEYVPNDLKIPFVTDALYRDALRHVYNLEVERKIFIQKSQILTGVPFENFD